VEKDEIKNYFSQRGYQIIDIQQIWRHVHGKLERDGRYSFFKMASTQGIGERTRNETSWNGLIHKKIMEADVDCFDVPTIHETGEYEGRFYYLADFYEGRFLAYEKPIDTEFLDQWLDKIVEVNLFLLSLKDVTFYRDRGLQGKVECLVDDFQVVGEWYERTKEYRLEKVFNEVENLRETYRPAVNHGDFVPWHMIQENDKFILVDAEHASGLTARYLDIVYLYHRLYTCVDNPYLAKKYLNKIRDNLPKTKRTGFEKSIRPIMAVRIIGGFQDVKAHETEDLTYHNELKKDFLKNNLF
jgi:hypothetical protein